MFGRHVRKGWLTDMGRSVKDWWDDCWDWEIFFAISWGVTLLAGLVTGGLWAVTIGDAPRTPALGWTSLGLLILGVVVPVLIFAGEAFWKFVTEPDEVEND